MTKKDYIIIAEAINGSLLQNDLLDSFMLKNRLVKALKADNPRFDEQRFIKACGFTN